MIDDFTEAMGLSHYTPYMQDYGGPVGFRMVLAHPERVQALIVQNAVAHNEGLGSIWATRRAFWADRPAHEKAFRENFLSFATTKSRHIGNDPNIELYDPDLWTDEYAFLNAPEQAQIQTDLFYRARIGLLTPNDDAVPESEFWTMAPEGVSVHVARVLLVDTRTFADPPHPDEAAALPMQAIVFAFTTSSYILGTDGEQALKARLEKRSNGIPVLLTCPAAVAAFNALDVRRIALIHPPWFADDQQQLGIEYFRNQGFDVVYANQMRLRRFRAKPGKKIVDT